jgi:hypothetical protein
MHGLMDYMMAWRTMAASAPKPQDPAVAVEMQRRHYEQLVRP